MKVLKSGNADNKWPKNITCYKCKAELLVNRRDCTMGEICTCPECGFLIRIELVPKKSSYNPFESKEFDIFPFEY